MISIIAISADALYRYENHTNIWKTICLEVYEIINGRFNRIRYVISTYPRVRPNEPTD